MGYKFQLHHAHREDESFPMRYHTYVFGEGKDSSRTRFLSPHFGLGLFSDSDFFRTRTQVGLVFRVLILDSFRVLASPGLASGL